MTQRIVDTTKRQRPELAATLQHAIDRIYQRLLLPADRLHLAVALDDDKSGPPAASVRFFSKCSEAGRGQVGIRSDCGFTDLYGNRLASLLVRLTKHPFPFSLGVVAPANVRDDARQMSKANHTRRTVSSVAADDVPVAGNP